VVGRRWSGAQGRRGADTEKDEGKRFGEGEARWTRVIPCDILKIYVEGVCAALWLGGEIMKKRTISYDTPVDALVAVAKRLTRFESEHRMNSEDFFDRYSKGKLEDPDEYVEWANDYEHYMALKSEVERCVRHVA